METQDSAELNRAGRRAQARRGRKLAALGSGAALATTGAAATVALTAAPAAADTITVTNTNDSGAGSLRQALADANDGDMIDLTGVSGTILLTSGQLEVDDAVTITGPGASVLTISGNDASRVLNIDGGVTGGETVAITGVTVADGNVNGAGAGVFFNCGGEDGSLSLDGVVITGNTATDLGAGLYFDGCLYQGDLTIASSTISNNETTVDAAGGIWFDEGRTLSMVNTTVAGNTGEKAGGLFLDDAVSFSAIDSTFSGNTASVNGGGGIYIDGTYGGGLTQSTIANSTISDNTADYGGGISTFYGHLALLQTTISGNTATGAMYADGLYLGNRSMMSTRSVGSSAAPQEGDAQAGGGVGAQQVDEVVITGTIISGNDDGNDVGTYGDNTVTVMSDHSLLGGVSDNITVDDQGGTQQGVDDPGLDPLGDNGGPTLTMALRDGSPAKDAGPDPVPDFSGNEFDQRGPDFLRVVFGRVDVGAYEVQAPVEPIVLVPTFTG